MEGENSKEDVHVTIVYPEIREVRGSRIVTFKIDLVILECWTAAAKALGFTSRSELIRVAVNEYLRQRGIICARESTG